MTATWRATEKANRRELYLESAARLFAERGFSGVTIDELGDAAGVSGPALYRHFAGKEAILTELLVNASERLVAGCESILAGRTGRASDDAPVGQVSPSQPHRSARQTLQSLVDFHIDFALSERDVIKVQDRELARLPPTANHTVRALQRRYVQFWSALLAEVCPQFNASEIDVRVLGVFGLLNSTPFSARQEDGERVRRIFREMAMAGLARELPQLPD